MTNSIPIQKNPVWRFIFTLISCAFLLGLSANAAEVVVFEESFETDGLGSRYTVENGSDDGSNLFTRRQEFSAGTRTSGGTLGGEFFFAGRDIDAAGDGTGVGTGDSPLASDEGRITFNPFSISGVGRLVFNMSAAQGVNEFEFDNVLLIEVKIDDGDFEAIGGFRGTFTNSPGRYFQGDDTTLPDHNVEVRLISAFTDHSWEIPGSGSTMQIRIKMNCNGGNEEYAIDNLTVSADDAAAGFTLAIDNSVISETAGAGAATVTVTLDNAAPEGGANLDISLVSPLATSGPEGEVTVPASVSIAAGATAGTFAVDPVADGRFDGDVGVRIFVTGDGFNKNFVPITVTNVDDPPNIVLNEFQAAVPGSIAEDLFADANGDGIRNGANDEFVEIVNISGDGTAVDLSGWVISDDIGPRHVFSVGSVLEDGRAIVVFGGGVPTGVFGGALIQTASQGNLGWSNSGDTIHLRAGGASVFAVNYVDALGNVDPSAVLEPELTGDYVFHDVATGTGGALFSPGTQNDGAPFGVFDFTAGLALSVDTIPDDAGAAAVTGTVTLDGAAPAGGLGISIESTGAPDRIEFSGTNVTVEDVFDPVFETTIRVYTLAIAEGGTLGTFDIDVINDGLLSGDRDWNIIVKEQDTVPGAATLSVTESEVNSFNFVINEMLQDSDDGGVDSNLNGIVEEGLSDQFVEIVNISGFAVNISGWQLGSITSDNFGINRTRIQHIFPDGTIVNDQGAIVIFGGDGDVEGHLARMNDPQDLGPSFGNAIVQIANEGSNGVNLASDDAEAFTSQLFNEHGFLMDEAKYVRVDAEQGQSLTRSPDITGDFFSPLGPSYHFDVSPAFLPFSPGTDISGVAFTGNGVADLDVFSGVDIPGFSGWKASSWYKNYNVDFWPWIYHDEHGWQFVDAGSTAAVTFVFDLGLDSWVFINEGAYRWIFVFGGPNAGWIFTFGDNSPDSRFFQRLDDGSLFSIPPGLPVN